MIRYAGYDPDENDFRGVDPAPLHASDLRAPGKTRINIQRALALKSEGLCWRRIGEILATEENRPMKYTADGVSGAVYRMRQKEQCLWN